MKTKEKIRGQRKIDRNSGTKFGDTFLEEYPLAERLGASWADQTTDGSAAVGYPYYILECNWWIAYGGITVIGGATDDARFIGIETAKASLTITFRPGGKCVPHDVTIVTFAAGDVPEEITQFLSGGQLIVNKAGAFQGC